MKEPWTFQGDTTVKDTSGGSVTLVEGASFSISSSSGDIAPSGAQGLFFEDTRFVSTWRVRLDDEDLQNLAVISTHPFAATFISRGNPHPGQSDGTLLVERSRYVGNGMREDIVLRNLGRVPTACSIAFELDADFAHIFEVKENRVTPRGRRAVEVKSSVMSFSYVNGKVTRGLEVAFPLQAKVSSNVARVDVDVAASGEWRTSLEFRLVVDGEPVELLYSGDDLVTHSAPVERLRAWEEATPRVRTQHRHLDAVFLQSSEIWGRCRSSILNTRTVR